MSEQQFRGALASGGTFLATGRGIEIFSPDGASLAFFGSEVISGVRRDSQVVTLERHNDTIVTLTAASITDAVGLEQYVRDTIVAPLAAPPPEPPPFVAPPPESATFDEAPSVIDDRPPEAPPLAYDAFDREPEPAEAEAPPPPRPPIISRPEPSPEDEQGPALDEPLPPPTPTVAPIPPPSTLEQVESEPEPIAPIPPPSAPPPPTYATMPQAETPPPAPPVYAEPVEAEGGGRRWWLWGCLGCLGLLILALICFGVLIATEVIDPDDFDDDDDPTPTPFVIVVTPTPTEAGEGGAEDPTATSDSGTGDATEDESGGDATQVPSGDVLPAGETATVAGMEVTYQEARIDTEGLFPPDPGREYLVLNFEITNTTDQPVVVSSLLQFELVDEAGESYEVALFADIETTLDAEIQPGDTLDGEIAFDVPEDSGPFTVTYADFITPESASWAVEQVDN